MLERMRGIALCVLTCTVLAVAVWLAIYGRWKAPELPAQLVAAAPPADSDVAAQLDELTRSVDELHQQIATLQQPREAIPIAAPTPAPTTPAQTASLTEEDRAQIRKVADDAIAEWAIVERELPAIENKVYALSQRYGIEYKPLRALLLDSARKSGALQHKYESADRVLPQQGSPERIEYDAAVRQLRQDEDAALLTRYGDPMAQKIRHYLDKWKFVEDG
ncbi:MAG: hypothetical protein EPO68_13170 [Planctomycetota bacterium]|nr:MAG: hypothetical protein EPO68_13170 [Planctomycetota bacterium]